MTQQVGSQDEVLHPSWSEQLIKWEVCGKQNEVIHLIRYIWLFNVGKDRNIKIELNDRRNTYQKQVHMKKRRFILTIIKQYLT